MAHSVLSVITQESHMPRQIDNAAAAHAGHVAEYSRRAAFHQPEKKVRSHQMAVGPTIGYPTAPHDSHRMGPAREDGLDNKNEGGHRFGPGKDGSDMSKLPCNM